MAIEMFTEKAGYIKSFENVKLDYMEHFTNVGLIFSDNGVILIDTGWGEKQAKAILVELEAIGKKPVAIVNTHSHLDHAGANKYIVDKTGCKVYCTLYESFMVRGETHMFHTVFSESAFPIPDGLENRGTLENTDPVVIDVESSIIIDGEKLDIISLRGHSDGHAGIAYEDILFCGDAVIAPDLMKNKIMFMTNPVLMRKTAQRMMDTSYLIYVPSHGKPFNDPVKPSEFVIEMLDNLEGIILKSAEEPINLDDMIAYVADNIDLHLNYLSYYSVAKVAVHSIANSCVLKGTLQYSLNDNKLYYKRVKKQ